jgi:hypothetical protein
MKKVAIVLIGLVEALPLACEPVAPNANVPTVGPVDLTWAAKVAPRRVPIGNDLGAAFAASTEANAPVEAAAPVEKVAASSAQAEMPRSARLPSGFYNPMPGGVIAGYQADTGLDVAGSPRPVFALAAGTLDYSEPGHTLWTSRGDTANCVRFELDTPIPFRGRTITHVYYAHLSKLVTLQAEGAEPRKHVEGGEMLGVSGVARGSPHLHIGLLLDGDVTQDYGTFLRADAVREVLGGVRNGNVLPRAVEAR